MIIKRIEGATRVFGDPGDMESHCSTLAIRDVVTKDGNFMVSAWEPTPDELKALNNGASVQLWIRGNVHPVVAMDVAGGEVTA